MKSETVPMPDLAVVILPEKDGAKTILYAMIFEGDVEGALDAIHSSTHKIHGRCILAEDCLTAIYKSSKAQLVGDKEIDEDLARQIHEVAGGVMRAWGFAFNTPNLPGILSGDKNQTRNDNGKE